MYRLIIVGMLLLATFVPSGAAAIAPLQPRSLDGGGNNQRHDDWGKAGTQYLRVAAPNYADGISKTAAGPPTRFVSNRIFNDVGQNLFSENGVSQWGWAWGQFIDHDIGLRDETPAESTPIAYDATDPLEQFKTNDFGAIDFSRTPAAPGTGVSSPRQQINTLSSYIDGSNVYGVTDSRLEWLRNGPVDGRMSNNTATLMLTDGYLPRVDARGNPATAPPVDLMGALQGTPTRAAVAGDVRANENIALTAIQTLFAREHNRIVAALPASLPDELRFQLARRVVGAEEQYVTYNEFLPAMGVNLRGYRGYDPGVNAGISNEFAVVGYRLHSSVHGEFDVTQPAGTYSDAKLSAFAAEGITVAQAAGQVTLTIPLAVAFGNPDLLQAVGEGPILQALAGEREYKNDEQIDNSMRSVLFQVPKPRVPDPRGCGEPLVNPDCFTGVSDLGAIDVERGRDHGMPSYNQLRRAFGLRPARSFTDITGESTDRFPPGLNVNDPHSLDFVELRDASGNVVPLGTPDAQEDAVVGIRKTTLAARLKAIYGSVDNLDAFVGMVSEKHVQGTEFGELQLAMWKQQFAALRDGDRFFYLNDPVLKGIEQLYGIGYRHTLAELIALNTDAATQPNVFKAPPQ
ncbi:MAG: peroxidase family protein [Gaiellaceae bacterium]